MPFTSGIKKCRLNEVFLLAEIIISAAVFILLGIFLAKYAGGPIYYDEVMYINHGLLNVKDPFIINRYTHIFFQKLFVEIADRPLEGVKAYWGFLVAGSAALTYVISRLTTKTSNILHAGISTLLYLTIPLLSVYSGNTSVDLTAGIFLGLTVVLYILCFRQPGKPVYLLSLMGLAFFLAFRSKETTLASAVLLIGFLFDGEGGINVRLCLKRLGYFMIGLLAGVVLFMLLNGLLLKDAWFGLRLSEYFQFKKTYIDRNIGEESKAVANWFTGFFLESTPYIFLAYLFSGIKLLKKQPPSMRLPWLIPLKLIVILSVIIGFSSWGVIGRHVFPILPLVCAFAPQLIVFDFPRNKKEFSWLAFSMLAAALLFIAGRKILVVVSQAGPYNYPDFLASTVYPITLIALIILVFLVRHYSNKTVFAPLLVFVIFIAYPLYDNTLNYFFEQTNVRKMNERLQAIEVFDSANIKEEKIKLLVFEDALSDLNYSSRDVEFIDLFNMYYDERLTWSDVRVVNFDTFKPQTIVEWQPTFILMSADEYSSSEASVIIQRYIESDYEMIDSGNIRFALFNRLK